MSRTSGAVSEGEGKPEGLTISEAMRRSKETGAAYTRPGACYWIKWSHNWTYRVSADDLIANDWGFDA